MANETNNYKLPKPEADDFYDISEYNKTMDLLDESLNELNEKKMDKNGDASEVITEYEQEVLKENIESGETLSVTHGKIKKWFSEMKDVAFSGKAKDLTPDAAHRFVTDTEKNDWNGKVSASGGDISGTVIGELENTTERYPVPDEGETTKVFMGKVEKFLKDIKPLDDNLTVYVATTGSDTTGDGSSSKPFKTITYALSLIPKNLNSHEVKIILGNGACEEDVEIISYTNGSIILCSNKPDAININCIIKSLHIRECTAAIEINSINICEDDRHNAVEIYNTMNVTLSYIKSVVNNPLMTSIIVKRSNVIVTNSELSNHTHAIYVFNNSKVQSINNIGTNNGIALVAVDGSIITTAGNQPNAVHTTDIRSGGIISSIFGAKIGSLQSHITLFVSNNGSDITGGGTEDNPFKTIQYVIDMLPKNLGGYTATVIIDEGTYPENVIIQGYHSGHIEIQSKNYSSYTSSDKCIVSSFRIFASSSTVIIKGLRMIECTDENGAFIEPIRVDRSDSVRLYDMKIIENTKSHLTAIYVTNHSNIDVVRVEISSHLIGIHVDDSHAYIAGCDGNNNSTGIYATNSAKVTLVNNRMQGDTFTNSLSGSMIIGESGTQISGLNTSGLLCTWGTIRGGYIRNGNIYGAALVTIQLQVSVTTTLSEGSTYLISGFPVLSGVDNVAVANNTTRVITWLNNNNLGVIVTGGNFAVGEILELNATYLTYS